MRRTDLLKMPVGGDHRLSAFIVDTLAHEEYFLSGEADIERAARLIVAY